MKRIPQQQIDEEARHLITILTARYGARGLTRILQAVRRDLRAKKLQQNQKSAPEGPCPVSVR